MTCKDPKDMTASELLRLVANACNAGNLLTSEGIAILREAVGSEETRTYGRDMAAAFDAIAGKIDAEIEAARMDAVALKPMWWFWCAIKRGEDWPKPRDGEKFREYLSRCFILRPRDEDGEPVQFGDDDIDWDYTAECRVPGSRLNATAVDIRGKLIATTFDKIVAVAKTDERGRVKRPAPEVLGGDGLPVVASETVYPISGDWIGDPLEVAGIDRDGSVRVSLPDGKGWTCYLADFLTHTPPDTQQRIDEDARKSARSYWDCFGKSCVDCSAMIDGKRPWRWYDTDSCETAQTLDLLRRQRELDARKGGVE